MDDYNMSNDDINKLTERVSKIEKILKENGLIIDEKEKKKRQQKHEQEKLEEEILKNMKGQ